MATSFTQSVEPGTGTSCTLMPAEEYHPFFVATAKGAAAEVMVLAQKPTLTTVSAASAAIGAPASKATKTAIIFLVISHP